MLVREPVNHLSEDHPVIWAESRNITIVMFVMGIMLHIIMKLVECVKGKARYESINTKIDTLVVSFLTN